jgi:hypothetical protein
MLAEGGGLGSCKLGVEHRGSKPLPPKLSPSHHPPAPPFLLLAQYTSLLSPVEPRSKAGARRLAELAAGHQRFCTNQLANKKTSRVLEAAFGTELTAAYMRGLMFDFVPSDSPPWFDTSVSRLYHHFDREPEPWKDGAQLLSIRRGLDVAKANTFLQRCAALLRGQLFCRLPWFVGGAAQSCTGLVCPNMLGSGCSAYATGSPARPAPTPASPYPRVAGRSFLEGESSIAGERLQFALGTLYDADKDFREAANAATPELAELRAEGLEAVGRLLEAQLLDLVGQAQATAAEAAGGGSGAEPQQQQQQQQAETP